MNILAIDTTTKKAGVAIKKDDKIFSKNIDNEITHSEKLLPLIDEVLNEAKLNIKDIDTLACVEGPGSFTGVRIGIATIKAIAKVINKEIVGTTSLKLMAIQGLKDYTPDYVLSLMDARNDRVYYELFENINSRLVSKAFLGNDYLQNVLTEIKEKKLNNLLILTDNENLKDNIAITTPDTNVKKVDLNLENIFTVIESEDVYNYLTLDAKYYRKSEAERTKDGE